MSTVHRSHFVTFACLLPLLALLALPSWSQESLLLEENWALQSSDKIGQPGEVLASVKGAKKKTDCLLNDGEGQS